MLSKITTGSLSGIEAELVTVETDFYNGLPDGEYELPFAKGLNFYYPLT